MTMSKHPADDKAPASGSDLFLDGSTFCFYWDNADAHIQKSQVCAAVVCLATALVSFYLTTSP